MNWEGEIGGVVDGKIRVNGAHMTKPKIKCRCGNDISVRKTADHELGSKLTLSLKELTDMAGWYKKWNSLMQEALDGKINLDKFYERYVKLIGRFDTEVQAPREATHSAPFVCGRCQTPQGTISVALRLIDDAPALELTKDDLMKLKPSPEFFAYLSKRMAFSSVEQLKNWLDDKDMTRAKGVLQKAISELGELALDYDTSSIVGAIQSQIEGINGEARRRKIELLDAAEKVTRERVLILR
jgi:ribosomal protein S4